MVETRGTPMSVLPKCCQITRTWQTNVVNWQKKTYCFVVRSQNRLTKKAEPPPTRDVNRDSGTASANGGWLRRLVRHRRPHLASSSISVRRRARKGSNGETGE